MNWIKFKGKKIARMPDSTYKNIKLPKGTNLISITQAIDLINEEKCLVKLGFDEYSSHFFEQPFKKNKGKNSISVAWSCGIGGGYYYYNIYYLYAINNFDDDDGRARGVIITK